MTSKNMRFFEHAKNIAKFSDYPQHKLGCIAVLGNKIISVGFNTMKTHPTQQIYNKYRDIGGNEVIHRLHAETMCLLPLRNLNIDFNKIDLYIYRICKSREHGLSRPCCSCVEFIKELNIKNIFYTTDNGFAHEKLVY